MRYQINRFKAANYSEMERITDDTTAAAIVEELRPRADKGEIFEIFAEDGTEFMVPSQESFKSMALFLLPEAGMELVSEKDGEIKVKKADPDAPPPFFYREESWYKMWFFLCLRTGRKPSFQ